MKYFIKIKDYINSPKLYTIAGMQEVIETYLSMVGYDVGLIGEDLYLRSKDAPVCEEYSYRRCDAEEIVALAIMIAEDLCMDSAEKKHRLRSACLADMKLKEEIKRLKADIRRLKGGNV